MVYGEENEKIYVLLSIHVKISKHIGIVMLIPNIIIILVIMMHPDLFVSADDDQDLFIINVTMKNYHSTKVLL